MSSISNCITNLFSNMNETFVICFTIHCCKLVMDYYLIVKVGGFNFYELTD